MNAPALIRCSGCIYGAALVGGLCDVCVKRTELEASARQASAALARRTAELRAKCWRCRVRASVVAGGQCETCIRSAATRAYPAAQADDKATGFDHFDPTPDEYFFAPGVKRERMNLNGNRGGDQ